VLPVVFNLQLEDAGYDDAPEFYLVAITDVNHRTTFDVNGMSNVDCLLLHANDSVRVPIRGQLKRGRTKVKGSKKMGECMEGKERGEKGRVGNGRPLDFRS